MHAQAANEPAIHVAPAPYVLIPVAAAITGLTRRAIQRKIADGVWLEGREYRRGPDGHIWISVQGVAKWVESAAA